MTESKKIDVDKYFYWEIIAAWVWELTPDEIFLKTRAGNIPYARFFCMYFMHKKLGLTQSVTSARYDQKHDQVVHAVKQVERLNSVDKKVKELFDRFMEQCDKRKNTIGDDYKFDYKIHNAELSDLKELSYRAWSNYASLIHTFKQFDIGKCDELEVIDKIILCDLDFNLIRKFFIK
jgi:hypothetical protein